MEGLPIRNKCLWDSYGNAGNMLLIYDEMVSKFWDCTCLVIKCQDLLRNI